jgi:hypothetical protein
LEELYQDEHVLENGKDQSKLLKSPSIGGEDVKAKKTTDQSKVLNSTTEEVRKALVDLNHIKYTSSSKPVEDAPNTYNYVDVDVAVFKDLNQIKKIFPEKNSSLELD